MSVFREFLVERCHHSSTHLSIWHESSQGVQGVFEIYMRLFASPPFQLVSFPELANRRRPMTMRLGS